MASRLYVIEMVGGPTVLRRYDLEGNDLGLVDMDDPISSISGLVSLDGDDVLFRYESYVTPVDVVSTRVRWLVARDHAFRRDLAQPTSATAWYAASSPPPTTACGSPVDLVMLKDTPRDGSAPLHSLTATAATEISQRPAVQGDETRVAGAGRHPRHRVDPRGRRVRGSVASRGQPGTKEALDGRLRRLCGLSRGRGIHEPVAAGHREGGSAGGLLVYGTMAHYPDRMGAVVSHVGFGDALRMELAPNGEFNVTEFGTVNQREAVPGDAWPHRRIIRSRRDAPIRRCSR